MKTILQGGTLESRLKCRCSGRSQDLITSPLGVQRSLRIGSCVPYIRREMNLDVSTDMRRDSPALTFLCVSSASYLLSPSLASVKLDDAPPEDPGRLAFLVRP